MNGFLLSAQNCAATTVKNFDLTETLSLLLVFGPIWLLIALLLVPIVLYLYVHNINGYMKVGAQGYTYMPQPMGTLQRPTAQDNTEGTADILDAVYRQFKTGRLKTLIIAFIYLACLCSLLILKDVSARESDMFEDALGMAWFCVLLSLPVFFLLCDSHKPALLISAALAVVAGVGVIQEAWQSGQEQSSESLNDFFWVMTFGMFFYAALCIRRYRRLVPFFTIVLMIAPIGMLAILVLIYWTGCTGWNIHKRDQEIVWLFLLLAAPCFWLLFTWMGLRFFSVAYTRRRISEQQLSVSCWFIITGLFIATLLQVEDDDSVKMVGYTLAVPPLMLLTLGAYLEISRVPSLFATPRSLLYLRVFRSSAQSRKLFRSAARPWRSVGPVNLIAGPDLAKLGVEPDEIYQFLCGNLHRLFIRTPEQLELAFNKPLNTTDPDGRYRVNEFFCFDGIWQAWRSD